MKRLWIVAVGVLVGCGAGRYEAVRTTQVEVRPVCPKPEDPPDSLGFLHGVARIDPDDVGPTRDRAFEDYLQSGNLTDRIRVVALALAGPPDAARDGRLTEVLVKDPSVRLPMEGSLGELDQLLRKAFFQRLADAGRDELHDAGAARERARSRKLKARLAEAVKEVQNLQRRLEAQGKKVKALEAQIEGLKGIERIIDRREQASPGG